MFVTLGGCRLIGLLVKIVRLGPGSGLGVRVLKGPHLKVHTDKDSSHQDYGSVPTFGSLDFN